MQGFRDPAREDDVNVEDVRVRVERVRAMTGDDEAAHIEEDRLWADVLRAIAAGAADPRVLARTALETEEIDFARWYA